MWVGGWRGGDLILYCLRINTLVWSRGVCVCVCLCPVRVYWWFCTFCMFKVVNLALCVHWCVCVCVCVRPSWPPSVSLRTHLTAPEGASGNMSSRGWTSACVLECVCVCVLESDGGARGVAKQEMKWHTPTLGFAILCWTSTRHTHTHQCFDASSASLSFTLTTSKWPL